MKTMQVISHVLCCTVLALGAACTGTTPSSATDTSAASGTDATGTRAGTDMNTTSPTDAGAGMTTTGSGTATSSGSATSPGTGTGDPTDANAYMATFATMPDPVFLMNAASSNLLEIQLGQTAAQRASNADVKRYAQMMVTHHTKATQDLKTIATPLGVQMPEVMMPVHQAMADKVLSKEGKDFDEAYMDAMEAAHKLDIAMFEAKSRGAELPTVKTLATNTLPMLRSHEKMASEIEKKVD